MHSWKSNQVDLKETYPKFLQTSFHGAFFHIGMLWKM
jgi:hypothetical protein